MTHYKNRILLFLTWLVALKLFAGCGENDIQVQEERIQPYCMDEEFKQQSEFGQPAKSEVTELIPLTGSVEPNPDKVVPFVSLVGGVVTNTYFSLGEEVVKGQLLADLKSPALSGLQAELKTLDARISLGEQKHQSVQSMFEDGVAARSDLVETQSELEILASQKQRVEANLSFYSASEQKDVFQIRAPASGIITEKAISAGTQISGDGEILFTVSDLREVWITVNVYATNLQNVTKGMQVDITTLSYPGETFSGEIDAIPQVLDHEAKVIKARVLLPNKDHKLKPGMLVDVAALKNLETEALGVPADAVIFDNNRHYLVVYRDDCDIEIREVDILTQSRGTIFIGHGLAEHEKVLLKNQLLVYEQLKNPLN